MDYSLHDKEVIGNIIGMNPTGLISFEGTFSMTGPNQSVNSPANLSKEKMKKTENNEFICDNNNQNKETFQNYQNQISIHPPIVTKSQCFNWILFYIFILLLFYIFCIIMT
jgi:ATP-dependent Zn protease